MAYISNKPLTAVQESLLAHGPNYAVVLRGNPTVECVTVVEQVCQKLTPGEADELRLEVKAILKKTQPPRHNLTKEEQKAIGELKRDKTRVILTADKGVSLVVMDKEQYINKAEELLNQPTHKTISSDPTTKYKNKVISLLKTIKAEGGMSEALYKRLYPTGSGSPKFYGLPKVYKEGIPLRPIVSSIGAVSYETSKELARILKPLVGKSPHHVRNTQDSIEQIKDIKLKEDQCMMSYDVKALFPPVPIQPALNTIQKLLQEDKELQQRTTMSVENITTLLEFCLKSTYFTPQTRFFEQQEGAAMGSPISPIVANLCMEEFETKAISSSPHPPYLWRRFVDDTFTIIKSSEKERFLEYLNTMDPNIQFTSEESREDGSMFFLDILITPKEDGSLSTTVYRKPTHTDLYIQWGSNHTVSSKYSVVGSLHHRAKTICSSQDLLQQEEDHLKQALTRCKYPAWAINKIKIKIKATANKTRRGPKSSGNNIQKPHMVIPYY